MGSTLSNDVVIATANRPDPLCACIRSLRAQTSRCHTVIVIDSSDNADSEQMLSAFPQDNNPAILYIHTSVRSAAVQRNIGIQASKADIVFFLDDDVLLESTFVEELLLVFSDDQEQLI
jgi:glycosyltransferase involved in cell wall biosynthesis